MIGQLADIDAEGEYCVKVVVYPQGNRDSLEQMAAAILQLIADDVAVSSATDDEATTATAADAASPAPPPCVSLLAESMGRVVSVVTVLEHVWRKQLAQSSSSSSNMPTVDIDLLLMVNPATSYRRYGPRELWGFLFDSSRSWSAVDSSIVYGDGVNRRENFSRSPTWCGMYGLQVVTDKMKCTVNTF